jgi:A/G-specific adenine glycosylase
VEKESRRTAPKLAPAIEAWFAANARPLPWRRTRDPYAIWISEVMLQQTQVKTVIPYWERWMTLFPAVEDLANAPEEKVLKAWEGLGYYTRARNLQRAAREVMAKFGGSFPDAYAAVLALPGIGRYTAGAICSIAFGQARPILDGNVARVLSRVFMVAGSPKDPAVQKQLWALSAGLIRAAADCSSFNQGLMALGATICLPRAALCPQCPLRKLCRACRTRRVDEYPAKPAPAVLRKRSFAALLVTHGGQVLVRRREAAVVNGGLWEFPNFELSPAQFRRKLRELNIEAALLRTIKHTITRNRITLRAFAAEANGSGAALAQRLGCEWRPLEELAALPFSSAHAKLRKALQGRAAAGIGA